jgi:hypothetical protein
MWPEQKNIYTRTAHYYYSVGGISRDLVLLFGRSFLMVKDTHPDQAMLFIRSLLQTIILTSETDTQEIPQLTQHFQM